MYYLSQKDLFLVVLYAFIVGAVLGVFWDVFRIIRKARNMPYGASGSGISRKLLTLWQSSSDLITVFEDIAFFLFAAITVCIFLYHANSGKVRGLVIFSSLLGFTAYYFTLGKLVDLVSEKLILFLGLLIGTVFKYTFIPPVCLLKKGFLLIFRQIRKKHLTKRTKSYIKEIYRYAEDGFGIWNVKGKGDANK